MFYCFVIPYQMIIGRCFGYHLLGCQKKRLIIIVRWHRKEIAWYKYYVLFNNFCHILLGSYCVKDLKRSLTCIHKSSFEQRRKRKEESKVRNQNLSNALSAAAVLTWRDHDEIHSRHCSTRDFLWIFTIW